MTPHLPPEVLAVRLQLLSGGYTPLPLYGKVPPVYGKNNNREGLANWQKLNGLSPEQVQMWGVTWPDAVNTGVLTRNVPTFDADILNPEAAKAVEAMVREYYEEKGRLLLRIGLPPKRAYPFRTDTPFGKLTINFEGPEDKPEEKLEFLCDGQQVVVNGIHPDTNKPYAWFGGEPWEINRDELPLITEAEANELMERAAKILADYGYVRATGRPKPKNGGGEAGGSADWQYLVDNIHAGRELHESLCELAAKLIVSGMGEGAAVNFLRGLMEKTPEADRDKRWRERYDDIPNLVDTASGKYHQQDTDAVIEPVDLWGSFEPPLLPHGLLPEKLENYARVQAAVMGVDPGGMAMASLTVCAAATPDSIKLLMKGWGGGLKEDTGIGDDHWTDGHWTEAARLWTGLVGLASMKKTPINRETTKPLKDRDARLLEMYVSQLRQWEEMDKKERKGKLQPVQTRLRLEDTTYEAAFEVLAGSPSGVLMVQDELSAFFGSMDKYGGKGGGMKDRGFWLQTYNGGEYASNRIVRGVGLVPNLSISLLGGIQPDVIRRVSADSLDDGFLQRMMLIVLRPSSVGTATSRPDVSADYDALIGRLTRLEGRVLRFNARAQDIRGELEVKHLGMMQAIETYNKKLAAHIGKYDGLFGRLCVTFHCIEHARDKNIPEFVTEDTAKRVAEFMHQFLFRHAHAFYSGVLGLADDNERLVNVAGYILTHKKQRVTNRDVQMGCRDMRKLERRDTEAVFEQLSALGWVTMTPSPRRGDPPHWNVNPRVHEKFTERAKQETERRLRVREIIAAMHQQPEK